jgi:hypothetical protein
MSLEEVIKANTSAMQALTEALMARPELTGDNTANKPVAKARKTRVQAAEELAAPTAPVEAASAEKADLAIPEALRRTTAVEKTNDQPVDFEVVKKALLGLVSVKGREAVVKLMADFGAERSVDLKPEHYAQVIEAANRAVK